MNAMVNSLQKVGRCTAKTAPAKLQPLVASFDTDWQYVSSEVPEASAIAKMARREPL
jgi:hypothetical protein